MQPHSLKLIFGLVTMLVAGPCLAQLEWPKSFITDKGLLISIYQPTVESFTGNLLKSRSVISILADGDDDPVFGVAWITDTVETDLSKRVVTIRSADVDALKIPGDSSRVDIAYISAQLAIYIPGGC